MVSTLTRIKGITTGITTDQPPAADTDQVEVFIEKELPNGAGIGGSIEGYKGFGEIECRKTFEEQTTQAISL